jgi:hypothetical protein
MKLTFRETPYGYESNTLQGHMYTITPNSIDYDVTHYWEEATGGELIDRVPLYHAPAVARQHFESVVDKLYYYRKLKATGNYKCAGHGAEDPKHRAFYFRFFQENQDNDPRFLADCVISPYLGDQFNARIPSLY